MKLSIYGSSGFIGKEYKKIYPENFFIERDKREPKSQNILYFISTKDNYNVFEDASKDVKINLNILCEVLNYCKDRSIVFNYISSWFVYGRTKNIPAKEDDICNPTGFCAITKKCAEELIISFCRAHRLNYRIIRLSNVLGKNDLNISKKRNAITWMINRLKNNQNIDLYDNGQVLRDFIHVHDACRAINLLIKIGKYNQIYNVGHGKPIAINEIIEKAQVKLNSSSKINNIPATEFHKQVQNKDFWLNIDKLLSYDFIHQYSYDDIINELCMKI